MGIIQIKQDDSLSQSKDLIKHNIEKLKTIFPEIVVEGKIDFNSLKAILGGSEIGDESYCFSWIGKSRAKREAYKRSRGTLRPVMEESMNWNTTQNLYIEGDNLEVLKLLQKSYSGRIKMIYIDPPYNTGNDFVYRDNYKDNLKNYQEIAGQIDGEGNKLLTNSDSDGRYHSNWLNMMLPRLILARNLLKEDGVIFISIDDGEFDSLKKICVETFGYENFLTSFIWRRRKTQANLAKHIAPVHDFILIFSKNATKLKLNRIPFSEKFISKTFKNPDNDPRGLYQTGPLARPANSKNKEFELKLPNGRILTAKWSCTQETFDRLVDDNRLVIPNDGMGMPRKKIFLTESKGKLPNTWLDDVGTNDDGAREIEDLFGSNEYFTYPKPTSLIQFLIDFGAGNDDIILDFFGGSSSTAHAVIDKNIMSKKKLTYIIVQLQESIEKDSRVYRAGFKNIAEIGKERIRRVVKKIKEKHLQKSKEMDLGFKVFKLDSSNIRSWDGNPDGLESSLFDAVESIKNDRSEEDVLYEILLKFGLDLTIPTEERFIEGKRVFNAGKGSLFICLGDNITSKVAEGIGKWKEECSPEICRVIFKDSGFTDVDKTNSVQILKRFGVNEMRSI